MLIYPFYLTGDDKTPGMTLAPEFPVGERTPPTFIVMTQDDRVEYAYAYALALEAGEGAGGAARLPHRGHGYGLGKGKGAVSAWPARAEEWMTSNGWLDSEAIAAGDVRRRPGQLAFSSPLYGSTVTVTVYSWLFSRTEPAASGVAVKVSGSNAWGLPSSSNIRTG